MGWWVAPDKLLQDLKCWSASHSSTFGYHDFGLWPAVYKKDLQELPGEGITKKVKVGTEDCLHQIEEKRKGTKKVMVNKGQ